MKKLIALSCLLFSLLGYCQTYITNVTVVDVEQQKLLPNQTVVITNGRISQVQPSGKIKIPTAATIIDGKGKFLAPGLTDAHVHFFQSGGLYTRPDAIDLQKDRPYQKEIDYAKANMETNLKRYLACGITDVIDVGATYNLLQMKENFKSRKDLPGIFMSGPLLTTYQPSVYKDLKDDGPFHLVQTIAVAQKMVQEQIVHKADLIKIWYIVDGKDPEKSARAYLPMVKAIIDLSHQNHLKVAVHATERLTAQLAVESGADFLVHNIEDEILKDDFIQLMKKQKTIVCPTVIASAGYEDTFGQNLHFSQHDFLKADPYQLGTLADLKHLQDTTLVNGYRKWTNGADNVNKLKATQAICFANLKKMADAGVLIATGTDAGNIGTLHASSYLAELLAMRKGGMNSWQILTASTLNGAKAANKENESGSIKSGKKANLILLNADPVADIANLSKIDKVWLDGVAYDPQTLVNDTPEMLAQRQLNAYNFRDIEAFLEPYAEDVEIYTYPDKLEYKGKQTMRRQYEGMFQKLPNLHCELKGRIVQGNVVIDKERVQFGKDFVEAVAIYHIENGKIKKVFFVD